MTDGKSWLQSKTIWGVIVSFAGILTTVVHFDLVSTTTDIETLASLGTTAAGLIITIIGRFKAKQTIN